MRYLGLFPRLILLALVVFLLTLRAARCDSTGKQKESPYFVDVYNPNTYQMGYVLDLSLVHPTKAQTWVSLRWHPSYSPMLYSENLLFCSLEDAKKFENLTSEDEIVIVYGRSIQTARIDSPPPSIVACRNLTAVVQIRTKEQSLEH